MAHIETTYSWDSFRKFIVTSTYKSFIPNNYIKNPELFPQGGKGYDNIYKEDNGKFTLNKSKEVTVVNAKRVIWNTHSTKMESTNSEWRYIKKKNRKFIGEASTSASVNLTKSKVLTRKWLKHYLKLLKIRNIEK